MMGMTVRQVALAVQGTIEEGDDPVDGRVVADVVTDSRQVDEGSLFVAIQGEHVDGHDYVDVAARSGAVAALVTHVVDGAGIAQIVVDDTVKALGRLAKVNIDLRRSETAPFTVVGITGSVGKTTTKDLLKAVLSTEGPTVAPVGSFNNEIGLPLTALKVGPDTRFLVAEMGANHLGEIAYLTTLVRPDIAVVLKVGVAHLGEFGSVENIQRAKSEIVQALDPDGVAVLNADDAHVRPMADIAPETVLWFGQGAGAEVRATDVTVDECDRVRFMLAAPGLETPVPVSLAISGRHNVMNALAVIAVAGHLGLPVERVVSVLGEQSRISPHRMAVSELCRNGVCFTMIDDSFNANPDSMRAGIDGLTGWHGADGSMFRIAVLGSMLELGGDEEDLHRQIGAYAADGGVDALIAVGGADERLNDLAECLGQGARHAERPCPIVRVCHDIDAADSAVIALAADHDRTVVLLKGSHASGLGALAERWERDARSAPVTSESDEAQASKQEGENR